MKAIGSGGEWWWNLPSLRRKSDSRRRGRRNTDPRARRRGTPREPLSSSSSSESVGRSSGWPVEFPFRQALTAASLTLTGDTIAQVRGRIVDRRRRGTDPDSKVHTGYTASHLCLEFLTGLEDKNGSVLRCDVKYKVCESDFKFYKFPFKKIV